MATTNGVGQRLSAVFGPGTAPAPLHAFLGGALALLVAGFLSRLILGDALMVPLLAPIAATAVLVFVVPASPMAQPRAVLGGHLIATIAGLGCAHFGDPIIGCAAALGITILVMGLTRTIHPPSGALALTVVLNGSLFREAGAPFMFGLVLLNSGLLLVLAALYHNLVLRHAYPHRPAIANLHATADPLPSDRVGVTHADIDAAMRRSEEVLDVMPADVETVVDRAERSAWQRRTGDVRAADIMSRDLVTVPPGAPVLSALGTMHAHRIRALPVVDGGRLVGVLTETDILRGAASAPIETLTAADAMTPPVHAISPDRAVADLVTVLADAGVHQVVVIDAERRPLGIITQSDLIAALYKGRADVRSGLLAG